MDKVKILLVAVGGYGGGYLRLLTSKDYGAEVVGVVDVMPDILEKCPEIQANNIPLYRTIADFYKEHTADLAFISSPIHLHVPMSLECMRNGSHVLCEKPLCLTLEEIEALDKCSAETGKFLAVGYQRDYRRDVLKLKEDILSGKFGAPIRLRAVQAFRRGSKYYARNNWAGRISVNGHEVFDSPFTNASAHNFQMLTFLLGKDMSAACDITGVEAELYRGNPNVENYDIACMRFSTDCGAEIYYYTAHPHATDSLGPFGRMEFEKGVITYGEDERLYAVMNDGETFDYGPCDNSGYEQKIIDAIDCVRNGTSPVCNTTSEIGHVRAVRMVQALPIKDIDPGHVDVVEDEVTGKFWHVKNLEKAMLESAENWKLPGEMGIVL